MPKSSSHAYGKYEVWSSETLNQMGSQAEEIRQSWCHAGSNCCTKSRSLYPSLEMGRAVPHPFPSLILRDFSQGKHTERDIYLLEQHQEPPTQKPAHSTNLVVSMNRAGLENFSNRFKESENIQIIQRGNKSRK